METSLRRLRDPEGAWLQDLARMLVLDATSTPMSSLFQARWITSQLAATLEALGRGELLQGFVERRLAHARAEWGDKPEAVGTHFPADVDEALRKVLMHPWTPDPELTHRILDQAAMRALVAEVLTTMLTRFRKRMSNLDGGILKDLGGRAARRSRGLFGGVADFADSVVGAVKEEVESGMEERVREFVDGATRDAMRNIAEHIADPAHEVAFAGLRVGILDALLDTPVRDLLREVDKAQPLEIVAVVVTALRSMVEDPDFVSQTEARVQGLLRETGDGTLGAWLQEVGLEEVWVDTTTTFVAERMASVVQTDDFADWWARLHA